MLAYTFPNKSPNLLLQPADKDMMNTVNELDSLDSVTLPFLGCQSLGLVVCLSVDL